jgi:hypothetical protein
MAATDIPASSFLLRCAGFYFCDLPVERAESPLCSSSDRRISWVHFVEVRSQHRVVFNIRASSGLALSSIGFVEAGIHSGLRSDCVLLDPLFAL